MVWVFSFWGLSGMLTLGIPLVRQAYEWTCGPACLASLFYYWGIWDGREPELYEALETTEEFGTPGENLIDVARSYGLMADEAANLSIDKLRSLVMEGYTVILSVQAWAPAGTDYTKEWENGHYVVLNGVGDTTISCMDPAVAGRYGVIGHTELMQRWHDRAELEDENATDEDEKANGYYGAIIIRGVKPGTREPMVME